MPPLRSNAALFAQLLTEPTAVVTSVSLATPFMSACGMASRASQIAPRVAIFVSAEAWGSC